MIARLKKLAGGCLRLLLPLVPLRLANALLASRTVTRHAGIAYGTHPRQKLDVYVPRQAAPATAGGRHPVIVFFYGGSWESGERSEYRFVADSLCDLGCIVVIPDYRLYPEVRFPQFVDDGAAAVAWTAAHIDAYGGDREGLLVMGHSAGAYIAALIALNREYLAQAGCRTTLRGMIGLAGPYDFLPLQSARLLDIFGTPESQQRAQPIHWVRGGQPPLLLLAGEQDAVVWPRNSIRLHEKVVAAGGSSQLVLYPEFDHIDMLLKLWKPLRKKGRIMAPIADFLAACAGRPAADEAGQNVVRNSAHCGVAASVPE